MDESPELDATDRWFAANLKAARGDRSQEAVAEYMREHGFPAFRQQTVARIEAGERGVQVGEALKLARAVRTPLEDLTRPPGVTQEVMALRGALGRLRNLEGEAVDMAREIAAARERVAALAARVRESGEAAELVQAAEGALATQGDEAAESPRSVSGPSESVL